MSLPYQLRGFKQGVQVGGGRGCIWQIPELSVKMSELKFTQSPFLNYICAALNLCHNTHTYTPFLNDTQLTDDLQLHLLPTDKTCKSERGLITE